MLKDKHILLGVTGGIAAYKAPLLVRELVKAGAAVQVVMTPAATQFVTSLTLSTLSQRQVIIEMFPDPAGRLREGWTPHIDLARWADLMLIAPASANTIAKVAAGFADNFLTTLVLALRCPLAIAPAMDVDMWLNETTQRNVEVLRQSGCHIIEPETGELASGLSGPGRLPEPDALLRRVEELLNAVHKNLTGKRVLVTAGPTQEAIDPIRYIGNRSSGKMGFAIANAAAQRGSEVTLITGPVQLRTPRNVRRIDVRTTAEMYDAVKREFPSADLVVMAAAVADFAPVASSATKLKREGVPGDRFTIELQKNPDILKTIGEHKSGQVLVGFALETENGIENAQRKLSGKHLDAIVLNNPNDQGAAFGSETNVVTVITANGTIEQLPRMFKFEVANEILNRVLPLLK